MVIRYLVVFLRITIAVILLQTLYFKFTAQPESLYIFEKIGMEPWGRIGSGIIELIGSILILIPAFVGVGALLIALTMSGAIVMHLTILGIEVQGDGGLLFYMAVFCCLGSWLLSWRNRRQIPILNKLIS